MQWLSVEGSFMPVVERLQLVASLNIVRSSIQPPTSEYEHDEDIDVQEVLQKYV